MKRNNKFGCGLGFNIVVQKTFSEYWYVDGEGQAKCKFYYNVTKSSADRLSRLMHIPSFHRPKYLTIKPGLIGWSYTNYNLYCKLRGDKE